MQLAEHGGSWPQSELVREVFIELEQLTTARLSACGKRELMTQLRGLRTALHAALAGDPVRVTRGRRTAR